MCAFILVRVLGMAVTLIAGAVVVICREQGRYMARPRSDLIHCHFRFHPDDLARLDAYAVALGLYVEANRYKGRPDRSAALRSLIREADPDAIVIHQRSGD